MTGGLGLRLRRRRRRLQVLTFSSLVAVTSIFHPEYFLEGMFWAHEIAKFATMVAVSLLCGLICRRYCPVDQKGYIITSKSSWFKVRTLTPNHAKLGQQLLVAKCAVNSRPCPAAAQAAPSQRGGRVPAR